MQIQIKDICSKIMSTVLLWRASITSWFELYRSQRWHHEMPCATMATRWVEWFSDEMIRSEHHLNTFVASNILHFGTRMIYTSCISICNGSWCIHIKECELIILSQTISSRIWQKFGDDIECQHKQTLST